MMHVKLPHLSKLARQKIGLGLVLLLGLLTWITCLFLLIEVTRQLLETLRYIVELAQMS